ncbi:MAG TPA: HAD-IIA family hydrolase [Pirellulaceae bacterium]|jgi:NagD protein
MPHDLSHIRHFVLDLDGTLYRGNQLFPQTLPFLAKLRDLRLGYTFLTNNTSRSKADYVSKLAKLGIAATEGEIYTPADSTIAHLREHLPQVNRLAVLGTPSLCQQFEQSGFRISWDDPQTVIVGFDTTLTYDRLCRTAWWISRGLPFIATHPDLVCPTDEPTVLIDCGAITAALTAATGRQPLVLGKPDPAILLAVCSRHGITPNQLAMVGDRIYTDIAMAQRAGAMAVLVLSGEATAADAKAMSQPPDLVVSHIGEFGELIQKSH